MNNVVPPAVRMSAVSAALAEIERISPHLAAPIMSELNRARRQAARYRLELRAAQAELEAIREKQPQQTCLSTSERERAMTAPDMAEFIRRATPEQRADLRAALAEFDQQDNASVIEAALQARRERRS